MKNRHIAFVFLFALLVIPNAHALSKKTWDDISNYSVFTLTGTALILPASRSDWQGFRQALYSIGAAEGGALLGKTLFPERRPDGSDNKSFPSGHTANAFASATTLNRRYGWKYGFPAYALATLTGVARVKADKHHWYDVVAGATIGSLSGWYFTDAFDDKVQIVPWVDSKGAGVSFAMQF
ncbi:MAG TPA: phosphatase PAP2 family protein [Aeromonadales bacterium]|nr:phosphatase PAP2 family protein [Aeromonadales bacterium]